MIQNYFKIGFRNLFRNRLYSLINIIGLAVSMSIVMLIFLYVKDDLSFDRFHKNGEHIFRLVCDVKRTDGSVQKTGNTGHIQGPIFKNEVPEVEAFCRFKNGWNTLVKKGNDAFMEEMLYADNTVFDIFSFDVLAGNAHAPFSKLNNIVISDKIAKKYFSGQDAIGKVMEIADEGGTFKPYEVSAIIKTLPTNSSLQFDILASFSMMMSVDEQYKTNTSWMNSSLNTFVLLNEKSNTSLVNDKLNTIAKNHIDKEVSADQRSDPKANNYAMDFTLQPFYKMHLDPDYFATNGLKYWSDIKYPKILIGIALILLLIACINFINLTLARTLQRSKEIGIRKTSGSTRSQLMVQFLSESFITTCFSFIPALVLAYGLLPAFCALTGKFIHESSLFSSSALAIYFCVILAITILAGGYPAIVLSGLQPLNSLKGQTGFNTKQGFRKSLIVFQFSIAALLMIMTAFITLQFNYLNSKPLGYDTTDRYRFWLPWEQIRKLSAPFKAELRNNKDIEMVSSKSGDFNSTIFQIEGHESDYVYYEHIDDNHLQLMNIPLVKGRYLSYQYSEDTLSNIVVNESFVKKLLPTNMDPLLYTFKYGNTLTHIVGVVKDFHYASFKEEIKPLAFLLDAGTQAGQVHVKVKNPEGLLAIKSLYKKYVPYLPIEMESLDEFRMSRYEEEIQEKKIVTYTAFLAIFIACLGLFGLATFMTEQRTKEIGIRKVLGAGLSSIALLISKDFIILVCLSFAVAIPFAYYISNNWLQNFTYRIEMSWWIFVFVFAISLCIALLTVLYQTLKAASANPVKSLRTE